MVESESPTQTLALLQRALDQTQALIAAISPDQAGLPTPCAGWSVRQLVAHLAPRDLRNFTIAARGGTPDWRAPAGDPGDDWAATFAAGARTLMEAWREADLDRPVPLPGGGETPLRSRAHQQIAELAVHGWDLTRATGRSLAALDAGVAEHALAWSRAMLRPEQRGPGRAFAAEVPVSESAPLQDRLAGWFGRDPAWTAAGVTPK